MTESGKFYNAAIHGNAKLIKDMINTGYDIDTKDSDSGMTALMWTIKYGNEKVLKMLAEENSELYLTSQKEIVEILLSFGAKLNIIDNLGYTAFMYSIQTNNVEIVKILLNEGANVNGADSDGKTSLMYSIQFSNEEIVDILLNNGAKINITYFRNIWWTALIYGITCGCVKIVKLLIESGADNVPTGFREYGKITNYLESITSPTKKRRISFLNNRTKDFII